MAPVTLEQMLSRLAREGELYERLPEGRVRCYACGHRCLIPAGQRGICKVRWNEDGRLMVPAGYVAGLQLDPVEKKPFFHAYPGSLAMSFGMLGCDYHCAYCVAPQTLITTPRGPVAIERLFDAAPCSDGDRAVRVAQGLAVYTHTGQVGPVRALFRHAYVGAMVAITPAHLPTLRLTPDHEVLAVTEDEPVPPGGGPAFRRARELTSGHSLAIPRSLGSSRPPPLRASQRSRLRQDDRYLYMPIRSIETYPFRGFVYNLEVEEDHSYLAQFVATHNCQNALTSQALRDPATGVPPQEVTPRQIVDAALRHRARILTSTYNEPLITSEWAVEVFKEGKARGFTCSYVSNGNATPEVLEYIRPWVDLYKVDLKGFDDRRYRKLGGVLQTVLDTIQMLRARGFWLEVVTLLVPDFNDSDAELRDIARFLVSVSPDIPWHVTAFHPDYKMTDRDATTARTLIRAAEIGVSEGLCYVYAGNLPGRVGPFENTGCPSCRALLVERRGYTILKDLLTPTRGRCPRCATLIPGVWG